MEWKLFFLQAGIVYVGYILTLILKNYLPTYFGEKGKNLATKEDIGEITKKVEEAKKAFTDKTEELKAHLLVQNQHNLNWKAAEREALIDYNKKVLAWSYFIVRFPLSSYGLENYKDLKKQEIELDKRLYECDIAEAHVDLFDSTQEFSELIVKRNLAILKLESLLEKAMTDVYYLCSICEIGIANKQPEEAVELQRKLLNDLQGLFIEFGESRVEHYKEVAQYNAQISDIIREKLREINKV